MMLGFCRQANSAELRGQVKQLEEELAKARGPRCGDEVDKEPPQKWLAGRNPQLDDVLLRAFI